jgi:hypothetical protein
MLMVPDVQHFCKKRRVGKSVLAKTARLIPAAGAVHRPFDIRAKALGWRTVAAVSRTRKRRIFTGSLRVRLTAQPECEPLKGTERTQQMVLVRLEQPKNGKN